MADRPLPKLANQRDLQDLREEVDELVRQVDSDNDARFTVIERALAAVIEAQEQLTDILLGEPEPQGEDGGYTEDELTEEAPEVDPFHDVPFEDEDDWDEEQVRREADRLRREALAEFETANDTHTEDDIGNG